MNHTTDQHLETIGAFFDGERVDADSLRAALATEEGRGYLVELAAMRELVAMPTIAAAPAHQPSMWSAKKLLAAAALIAIVGSAGFGLGSLRSPVSAPPSSQAAPEPTKVLKLETGVNWQETSSSKGSN